MCSGIPATSEIIIFARVWFLRQSVAIMRSGARDVVLKPVKIINTTATMYLSVCLESGCGVNRWHVTRWHGNPLMECDENHRRSLGLRHWG